MRVTFDSTHHQQLEIHVEQMPHTRPVSKRAKEKILHRVHELLLKESSEYEKTFHEKGKRILPHIIMHPHHDPTYFPSGTKQKWVK
jgi:hypothetical protein